MRAIKKEVKKAKEISHGGIIATNIMVATKFYDKYVKAAIDAGVDMIISGAGLPLNLPELARKSKVKLAPIVSSKKAAQIDRKSTRLNSSHCLLSRMPSSA